jgi:hypothetical protein
MLAVGQKAGHYCHNAFNNIFPFVQYFVGFFIFFIEINWLVLERLFNGYTMAAAEIRFYIFTQKCIEGHRSILVMWFFKMLCCSVGNCMTSLWNMWMLAILLLQQRRDVGNYLVTYWEKWKIVFILRRLIRFYCNLATFITLETKMSNDYRVFVFHRKPVNIRLMCARVKPVGDWTCYYWYLRLKNQNKMFVILSVIQQIMVLYSL